MTRLLRIDLQLFAQVPDMYGNGIFRADRVCLPDGLIDVTRREHGSCIVHQQREDLVFDRGQRNGHAVQRCRARLGIERNAADRQDIRIIRLSRAEPQITPQLRANPRHDLCRRKRLCDIVIRTDVQAEDLVGILRFRRQQDHRHIAGLADLCHCRDAVHFRHHDVHKNQLDILRCRNLQCLFSGIGTERLPALCTQINIQGRDYVAFIVTN